MKGLVHIYTGDGKGKTTAAVGLGIRACGSGMKVLMVQFLKGAETGEMHIFERLKPDFEFYRSKQVKGFIWNMTGEQKEDLKTSTQDDFKHAVSLVQTGQYDLLILDEVMGALSNGLLSVDDIIEFINSKPEKLEVVLTGRNAPEELIKLADYVSQINPVKHPFSQGISARKGIEF